MGEKPIISQAGRFYVPDAGGFSRSLRPLTEALIRDKDPSFFDRRYLRARDRYLEDNVAEVFRKWFGPSKVGTNLVYTFTEEGEQRRCELDCLAVFGDAVFLIESKAGSFRPAARRGGLPSIVSDAKRLVATAHDQALRAKRFIETQNPAVFTDSKGVEVTRLDPDRINHFFLITVTLEHLGVLTSHLPALKKLNVIDGKTWPWPVSLPDLLAVHEVLDRPSLFLHYLHQRVPLNRADNLIVFDELDIMIHYLEQGLWTNPVDLQDEFVRIIATHTNELDKYYQMKELGKAAKKPSRALHAGLEALLAAIEEHPGEAGASCTCSLLDCDEVERNRIGSWVSRFDPQTLVDGGPHSLTLVFNDPGLVLLIGCDTKSWTRERGRQWARKWLAKSEIRAVNAIHRITGSNWLHRQV